jgi:hypothetical protein
MTYKRSGFVLALALSALAMFAAPAGATHFRGGALSCQQAGGNHQVSESNPITISDPSGPTIVAASGVSMWPPNHVYVTFTTAQMVQSVTDNCAPLAVSDVNITSVSSDEPENTTGDGNTLNDIVIAADCKSVNLRRERRGDSNGRVYHVEMNVLDPCGNYGFATYTVKVAHNPTETVVDDGAASGYTVYSNCSLGKASAPRATLPQGYALEQNFPNPFNPSTVISYTIPSDASVLLTVYDLFGREIATLVNAPMTAGTHRVNFDASSLPSGSYLYALQADGVVMQKSMQLVK